MIKYPSKEEFEKYYYTDSLTYKDIGYKIGCSASMVMKIGRRYGIVPRKSNPKIQNLIGQRFGKLLVLTRIGQTATCICDCGNTLEKCVYDLKRSGTRMCHECKNKIISEKNWKGYEEISGDVWWRLVSSAKKRNLEFNISMQDIWELYLKQNRKCALSGVDIQFARARHKSEITASLDRIDSSKGYTIDNIQWIHKDLNRMKLDTSVELFVKWCKLVTLHNK